MELSGRRVLVTGASRGIGEALARRFASEGAIVALVARDADALAKLASDLGGTAHPTDLADPVQVSTLVHRVEDEAGPVDVLVNNAGIAVAKSFADFSADDARAIYQVNLLTPVELCRQAIPRMLRRELGHIVNVSSLAGVAVFPGLTAYSSTKAGLTHFTAGLRADLRGLPIGTTVVELGPIPTDMLHEADSYGPTAGSFRRMRRIRLLANVPREKVAERVVSAVSRDRRHVRIPARAVLLPLLTEAPRRAVEVLLTGVRHQSR